MEADPPRLERQRQAAIRPRTQRLGGRRDPLPHPPLRPRRANRENRRPHLSREAALSPRWTPNLEPANKPRKAAVAKEPTSKLLDDVHVGGQHTISTWCANARYPHRVPTPPVCKRPAPRFPQWRLSARPLLPRRRPGNERHRTPCAGPRFRPKGAVPSPRRQPKYPPRLQVLNSQSLVGERVGKLRPMTAM